MPDTKILQTIIDKITSLEKETKAGFKQVNDRLDKIGTSVAYLEDDTPTIDEFNKLVRRVTKLENRLVAN